MSALVWKYESGSRLPWLLYNIPRFFTQPQTQNLYKKAPYPGVDTPDTPDGPDVLDTGDGVEGAGVGRLHGFIEYVGMKGGL